MWLLRETNKFLGLVINIGDWRGFEVGGDRSFSKSF
jgi:hypothetical protein